MKKDGLQNIFVTGPGFQMAQIFIEKIFETHVDWIQLINTDDNYKNQLQVMIQKEFKTTPDYLELKHDVETGYVMGVFLCVGQHIYNVQQMEALPFSTIRNFEKIQAILEEKGKVFIFLGRGAHKIKKKAEQIACEEALKLITLK